jgi:hypothetical protein
MNNTKNIRVIAGASLLASAMPALAITLYFAAINIFSLFAGSQAGLQPRFLLAVFVTALVISAAHVLLLGLPAVWLLHSLGRLRLWTLLAAGYIGACLPMAIWSWPVDPPGMRSSYSYGNGSETIVAKVDGVPTLAGWLDYVQSVAFVGLFGGIAALAFWWVIRHNDIFTVRAAN